MSGPASKDPDKYLPVGFYVLRRIDSHRPLAMALHPMAAIRQAACDAERIEVDEAGWHAETWQRLPVVDSW